MGMRLRFVPFLSVILFCGHVVQGQVRPPEQWKTGLILTYRCKPAQRLALREHMASAGLRRLEQLSANGILSSYRVLFSRYVDNDNWDMMIIVLFPDQAAQTRWCKVESESPAALAGVALTMVDSVITTPADLVMSNAPVGLHPGSVFLVIPYDYKVSTLEYLHYLDGYVMPQLDNWVAENNLAHYEVYIARYGASRPWSALLVLEYADEEALALRNRVIARVRERLKGNPSWKSLAEGKENIRLEKQAVVSDELRVSKK
jgi:hypothetical protein